MKLFAIIASLFMSVTALAGRSDVADPSLLAGRCEGWTIDISVGVKAGKYSDHFDKACINDESANYLWEFRYEIGDKSASVVVRSLDFPENAFAIKKFITLSATEGISPEVEELQLDLIAPLLAEGSASSLQLAQQKWSAEIHRLALIDHSAPK
jgi:hypothetical protein